MRSMLLPEVVRWVGLVGLASAIGALVVDLLVVGPVASGGQAAAELDPARRWLARWCRISAAIVTLASLAELVLRARTMTAGDLSVALAAVPAVLARTHFGGIWIVRG